MLFLVVDDDALSRELLQLLLEAEGHEVEVTASGDDAVSWLGSLNPPPGVILADMQMPGLSGNALAAKLRDASPAGTLLFAMSGSQPAASISHFDGFLLKPFTVSDVAREVEAKTADRATGLPVEPRSGPWKDKSTAESTGESKDDASLPPLDEGVYGRLREIMPAEQLGQMYAMCLADARARIARMRALAADRDDSEYRREAHAVKGGSGMIGATELHILAGAAEVQGLGSEAHQKAAENTDQDPVLDHDGARAAAGTSSVTDAVERLSRACVRLERILVERGRDAEQV